MLHTIDAMLQLCFGTEAETRAVLARINEIHDRVNGRLPEAGGIVAAGTPYSAHDPALLAWVHATRVDMNLRVYELYVGRLGREDKDRYCAEAASIETGLGIPHGLLPRSFGGLVGYMDDMLASGVIAVTDNARRLARDIVHPPAPRVATPALALVRWPTIGLLPPVIREAYGFAWSPSHERMLRRSAWLVRHALPVTPSILRHWPAARRALRAARRRRPR